MKRLWFAVLLPLCLGVLSYSCNNNSSNQSFVPTEEELIQDVEPSQTDTQKPNEEDDGDPKIKAASVDTMEMVVDNRGNLIGRYVQTNQTTYTISVQNNVEVPRLGHKIVVYKAKNGQGVVFTYRKNVNVRQQPDLQSPVIYQITTKDGETPKTYPCLGKAKGWYKIKIRGTEGYVRHDLVIWDGMDTF